MSYLIIKGSEDIKIALAGVGNPTKPRFVLESKLNFANRNAEKTGRRIEIYDNSTGNPSKLEFWKRRYIITPGKTPNVTISANESSCLPNSENRFNKRAERPSRKSNTEAIKVKIEAIKTHSNPTRNATKIPKNPQDKFAHVNKFGICFFNSLKFK